MKNLTAFVAAIALGLMGCAGSGDRSGSSTTSPPTTVGCPSGGSTADVRDSFPNRMSAMVGQDVRTGAHRCFERFVIQLQPTSPTLQFPGYWVRYVPAPISLSPSGIPITIRGRAVLMVSLASWMNGPDLAGYSGPNDVFPTNVDTIREYRLVEDFEGQSAWALGLDRTRSFTVLTLQNPARLVVDLAAD